LIKVSASVNLDTLNLYAALVLLELESQESEEKVLERLKEYPRVVHVFLMLAGYNLAALVIAENLGTLESKSMEKRSLRSQDRVHRSEFYPIGNIQYSPFLPIRENWATKERDIAPCNVNVTCVVVWRRG